MEFDTTKISVVYTGEAPDGPNSVHIAVLSATVGVPGLADIEPGCDAATVIA